MSIPVQRHRMVKAIHNILIIANLQQFGICLETVLRGQGHHTTLVESAAAILQNPPNVKFGLVIATNTSMSADQLRHVIPEMKARLPDMRIVVLSGYCPDDFVTDLKENGVDGFLPLPFVEKILLKEVASQLSGL